VRYKSAERCSSVQLSSGFDIGDRGLAVA
jgi:hypothetical protein